MCQENLLVDEKHIDKVIQALKNFQPWPWSSFAG
jgi:hypothetical protein